MVVPCVGIAVIHHTAKFPEFSGSYLLACARYPPGGGGVSGGNLGIFEKSWEIWEFVKSVAAKPPEIKER